MSSSHNKIAKRNVPEPMHPQQGMSDDQNTDRPTREDYNELRAAILGCQEDIAELKKCLHTANVSRQTDGRTSVDCTNRKNC